MAKDMVVPKLPKLSTKCNHARGNLLIHFQNIFKYKLKKLNCPQLKSMGYWGVVAGPEIPNQYLLQVRLEAGGPGERTALEDKRDTNF